MSHIHSVEEAYGLVALQLGALERAIVEEDGWTLQHTFATLCGIALRAQHDLRLYEYVALPFSA
ncbi:MAG: hypothetical protein H0T53_15015 [Herpetosiphonaceae bacterium]|nr:hypothetical protein [Herpetosiphonaceae bacterium]